MLAVKVSIYIQTYCLLNVIDIQDGASFYFTAFHNLYIN